MSVVHGMGVAGVRRVTEDTGNETTTNATTGGLVAFSRYPDRGHLLRRQPELLDSAVEEILRYTSVIQHVTRTVLRPQTLAGTGLYPGDLLCVWVASANRDEEVFTEPDTFRIDRDPNPHLAFTAGKHFCLGASLSRVESIHLFGFPIRKPTNLILAYANVPGRTTGWLIQAKGWLIQLRPTGRDELTE
jgi:cytochrome P450